MFGKKIKLSFSKVLMPKPNFPPILFQSGASLRMQKQWQSFPEKKRIQLRRSLIDSDRDGVPDRFDCQPFNRFAQDDNDLDNKTKRAKQRLDALLHGLSLREKKETLSTLRKTRELQQPPLPKRPYNTVNNSNYAFVARHIQELRDDKNEEKWSDAKTQRIVNTFPQLENVLFKNPGGRPPKPKEETKNTLNMLELQKSHPTVGKWYVSESQKNPSYKKELLPPPVDIITNPFVPVDKLATKSKPSNLNKPKPKQAKITKFINKTPTPELPSDWASRMNIEVQRKAEIRKMNAEVIKPTTSDKPEYAGKTEQEVAMIEREKAKELRLQEVKKYAEEVKAKESAVKPETVDEPEIIKIPELTGEHTDEKKKKRIIEEEDEHKDYVPDNPDYEQDLKEYNTENPEVE